MAGITQNGPKLWAESLKLLKVPSPAYGRNL